MPSTHEATPTTRNMRRMKWSGLSSVSCHEQVLVRSHRIAGQTFFGLWSFDERIKRKEELDVLPRDFAMHADAEESRVLA